MIQSMYIHVPFCEDICGYCDFTRVKIHPILVERYLFTLYAEIKEIPPRIMNTLYIGGGTPTSLSVDELSSLLSFLNGYHDASTEFTVEANPESIDDEKAALMASFGVNRVSMGVQTFDPDELRLLNRTHTPTDIQTAISTLRRHGITNISIDLIYGLPTQTLESWQRTLHTALNQSITHISLYSLTIEEHSEFGRKGVQAADPDLEAAMYFEAVKILEYAGFHRYEISSFTQDKPSRHNLAYWRYDDFYGLGPGATEMTNHRRILKTTNLEDYAHRNVIQESILLSVEDERFEFVMMGLRLTEGIQLDRFKQRFGADLTEVFAQAIETNIKRRNVEIVDGYLRTTHEGMALLNDVLVEFVPL